MVGRLGELKLAAVQPGGIGRRIEEYVIEPLEKSVTSTLPKPPCRRRAARHYRRPRPKAAGPGREKKVVMRRPPLALEIGEALHHHILHAFEAAPMKLGQLRRACAQPQGHPPLSSVATVGDHV